MERFQYFQYLTILSREEEVWGVFDEIITYNAPVDVTAVEQSLP